jgi:hypothetical protein
VGKDNPGLILAMEHAKEALPVQARVFKDSQEKPKPTWQPATEGNLVVGEWYWVGESPWRRIFKVVRLGVDGVWFKDLDGRITYREYGIIKIQPAPAPPELEE